MSASRGRRGQVRRTTPDGAPGVALEVLAREAGLHPELVRRLIALGALEPRGGSSRAPLFPRDAAARLARVARLRRDLGVNYGRLLERDGVDVGSCRSTDATSTTTTPTRIAGSRSTSRPARA
jgi:hypothetical protein